MKKGFTLVELLASIVVLSILTTLATIGYGNVSLKMKQTALENKISRIETAAANYASDTGYLTTNVNELMEKGYLPADTNEGKVENPVDNSSLNCHLVTIRFDNNNYYAEYSEDEECDLGNVDVRNINLEIIKYEEGSRKEVQANEWTKNNLSLFLSFKDTTIDKNNIAKITWISNGGREDVIVNGDFDSKKEKLVTASQIMNTPYSVEVALKSGTIYQARTSVKIDKQSPVVFTDETKVENEGVYVNKNKKVKVSATDRNGSGVYGYYIGTSNDCKNASYVAGVDNYEKELDNGKYYVCVKDNVGNLSEDISTKTIEVSRVDKVAPTCKWSGESESWIKGSRTITLEGVDNESGSTSSFSQTFSTGTVGSSHLSYEITDAAGNKTTCEKDVNVYIDNEAPDCSWTGEDKTWTGNNRTITLKGVDVNNGSGSNSNFPKTYSAGTTTTESLTYTVTDAVGNSRVCTKTVDVYVDKEAPNCSWSGEESVWTRNNRTITLKGIDVNNGSGSSSNFPKNYTSGTTKTESLTYTITDAVGNSRVCTKTVNVYVDKEGPSCSWSGEGNTWTKNSRTITLKGVDVNNGSGMGTNNGNSWSYLSGTTSTSKVNYVISDAVGNTTTCSKTADVYVDKEAPNCSWSGEGNSWTKNNRTITLKGVDVNNGSGSSYSKDWNYTSGTTSTIALSETISDAVGNTKTCSKSASVYVDKEAPNCSWSGEDSVWTRNNRTITLKGADVNNGSGSSSNFPKTYSSGTTKTDSLTYTVADAVGNSRVCTKTVNVYVDKEGPSCSWSGENNTWTNSNRTITLKGSDVNSGSGIGTNSGNSWIYTRGTTSTASLSYVISDAVGNTTTCSKTASVYVDKEGPSCSWSGEGYGWTNSNRTITLKGVDVNNGSGSSYSKDWSFTSGTTSTIALSETISDAVGNTTNCSKSASVYVDKDAPECSWSGENNTWTKNNRTVTLVGSDKGSGSSSSYSWAYNSGTTSTVSLSKEVKDAVGNTRTCSKTASVYVDKEAPDCSWSGEGYNWTNGNRIITVKGVDVNNGSGSSSTNSWSYTSGTTGTANLSYAISDSAGNTRTCSKTASVYVDKEAPNCSWGGEGYSWTNSSRTITLTGVDVNSGSGSSSSYSWPYTSGTTSTASLSGEVSDAVGNKKNCSKSASVYVDKEPPTKPTRGAIGGVSGSNSTGSVQIPAGGSTDRGVGNITYQYIIKNNVTDPSKNDSGFSSSMSFRRSCGTSYYAWAIAVDGLGNRSDPYYLGSTADGANHYNAWGACSKDCDGGVQYRTNNCALITSSLSQSCNTQKCTNCNYYFGGFTHTYSSQSTPRPSMRHNVATNVNITDCNTLSFTVTANLRPTGNNGVWCTCGGGSFCHCDVYYTIHIGSTSYDIYLTRRWNRQGHYGEDYTEYAYGGLLAYGNRYNLFNDDYLYDNYYNNVARNITLNVSSLTGNVDIYTEFGGDSNSWWGSNSFTFSGFTLKD